MAIWRDWSASAAGGTTTITVNHRLVQNGLIVVGTAMKLNSTIRIGFTVDDLGELDGSIITQGWTQDTLSAIRERLRINSPTPGYGIAQVRQACQEVFGIPENTQVQIA